MRKSFASVLIATGIGVALPAAGLAAPAAAVAPSANTAEFTMTASQPGFDRIEAEEYSSASGSVLVQPSGDSTDPGNKGLALLRRDSRVSYDGVGFGTAKANSVDLRVSSAVNSANGKIEVRSGGADGKVIGSLVVPKTASWQDYKTVRVPLTSPLTGTNKITLTFSAGDANPFVNVNWLRFQTDSPATPTPTPTATPTPPAAAAGGFARIEAEKYASVNGSVLVQPSGDSADPSNKGLALLQRGPQVTYDAVNFGTASANSVDLRLSSAVNSSNGTIQIRRGGADGEVVGSLVVPKTSSWQDFRTVRVPLVTSLTGTNKITLTFSAGDANPFVNLNWLQFNANPASSPAVPTPTATPTPPAATPTPPAATPTPPTAT
ncbi:MAG: carbohydrate-binding protein, partial [Candidatus Nanopelagicales bacterium]